MRVIDPEDLHAMIAPESHHPDQLLEQSALIGGVEIDRVDILVLLGRVLSVLDAPVWPMMKPLRMLAHPRMVGRALDREGGGYPHSQPVGGSIETIEVNYRPERRIDRSMTSGLAADCPRTAGEVRTIVHYVAGSLAIGMPNRVNRREVDDVKTQVAKLRQPAFGIAEGARFP